MPFSAAKIAERIGGIVAGDGAVQLTGFAPVDHAGEGDLTFAENEAYFARAEKSAAAAILVSGDSKSDSKTLIRVPNARAACAALLPLFFPEPEFKPGIHPSAVVDDSAFVDSNAHIGANCVIEAGAQIGPGCVIEPGCVIGRQSLLGEGARLFPNVTVGSHSHIGQRVRIHSGSVIGSDGFGYVFHEGSHRKIPQVGNVIVGDDVEIGSCVTIDRGVFGPTRIGKGTKIDNLVQIAHNVTVGEHCLLIAQVGIAGSTTLGNRVTLAGQVGLAGHIKIGDQVTIGAQSGVMHDIPDGETWLGSPAQDMRQMKKIFIAWHRLPDLLKRVSELEKHLERSAAAAAQGDP